MLVVDSKATGEEILALSIWTPGLFILWERAGDDDAASDLLIRLVTARARDMSLD